MNYLFSELAAVCGLVHAYMNSGKFWGYEHMTWEGYGYGNAKWFPLDERARPKAPEWAWPDLKVTGEQEVARECALWDLEQGF